MAMDTVVQDGTRVNFITDGWVVVRKGRGVWRGVDMCACGGGRINVLKSSLDVYILAYHFRNFYANDVYSQTTTMKSTRS